MDVNAKAQQANARTNIKRVQWLILLVGLALPFQAWGQWKPKGSVEIISTAGAGGGIDACARMLQRVLHTDHLLDVPSIVVDKPGGGTRIALNYLEQHKGDGRYIAVISPTLITNYLNKTSPYSYTDFTPIAQLYKQPIAFAVRAHSSLKSAKDLIKRLKSDPSSITFGTSSIRGNHNYATIGLLGKAIGVNVKKLKIVIFKSGAPAATAVMGRHIDVVVISAGVVLRLAEAGELKILAVTGSKRGGGALASVPTWEDYGINIPVDDFKALIGPGGMSAEQVAYWDEALGKVVRTAEWKKFLHTHEEEDDYMNSKGSAQYWKKETAVLKPVLAELGLGK